VAPPHVLYVRVFFTPPGEAISKRNAGRGHTRRLAIVSCVSTTVSDRYTIQGCYRVLYRLVPCRTARMLCISRKKSYPLLPGCIQCPVTRSLLFRVRKLSLPLESGYFDTCSLYVLTSYARDDYASAIWPPVHACSPRASTSQYCGFVPRLLFAMLSPAVCLHLTSREPNSHAGERAVILIDNCACCALRRASPAACCTVSCACLNSSQYLHDASVCRCLDFCCALPVDIQFCLKIPHRE